MPEEFLTFVMSETTVSQIKALPTKSQLKFFWAVANFGIHGVEPDFTGTELAVWISMRDLILHAKRKNEAWLKRQKENGKKGGRPKTQNNPDNPGVFPETQDNPAEPGITQDNPGVIPETQDNPAEPRITQDNPGVIPETHNGNGNVNVNDNGNGNPGAAAPGGGLPGLFIKLWQQNGDVFNFMSRLENPGEWAEYWRRCNFSPGQVEKAVSSIVSAVKSGKIERRYIPATPDRFVLKGWLQRGMGDVLEPGEDSDEELARRFGKRRTGDGFAEP